MSDFPKNINVKVKRNTYPPRNKTRGFKESSKGRKIKEEIESIITIQNFKKQK